ncbi:MAG: NAD(P)-dependent dehydrogenase (short-subunit alcohol dehydrogenase family) [Candidatus Azotimanducaceae bacterium]
MDNDCFTALLDVRDKTAYDDVTACFSDEAGGRLDILFSNSGVAIGGFFDEVPFEKIVHTVNINLTGVLNGVHAAMPLLKQTDNSLCFSTSSSFACFGTPGMATKRRPKWRFVGTDRRGIEFNEFVEQLIFSRKLKKNMGHTRALNGNGVCWVCFCRRKLHELKVTIGAFECGGVFGFDR